MSDAETPDILSMFIGLVGDIGKEYLDNHLNRNTQQQQQRGANNHSSSGLQSTKAGTPSKNRPSPARPSQARPSQARPSQRGPSQAGSPPSTTASCTSYLLAALKFILDNLPQIVDIISSLVNATRSGGGAGSRDTHSTRGGEVPRSPGGPTMSDCQGYPPGKQEMIGYPQRPWQSEDTAIDRVDTAMMSAMPHVINALPHLINAMPYMLNFSSGLLERRVAAAEGLNFPQNCISYLLDANQHLGRALPYLMDATQALTKPNHQ